MRGLIVTLDAMVAVSFLFLAILLLSAITFQPHGPRGTYLKQITLDSLAVMEKTDSLGSLVEGNSSGVRSVLENTPDLVCIQVSVTDGDGSVVASIEKNDCGHADNEVQTALRHFIYSDDPYMVKALSWYRKEIT